MVMNGSWCRGRGIRAGFRRVFRAAAVLLLAFYGVAILFHLMPMLCPHFRGYAVRQALDDSEGGGSAAAEGGARQEPALLAGVQGCCPGSASIRSVGHRGQCPYVLLVLTPTLAEGVAVVLTMGLLCGILSLPHYRSPLFLRAAFAMAPRAPPLSMLA